MDHFPLFGDCLKGIIKTNLLEFHPYDDLGFHEFPIRVGFTENEMEQGLLDGQTSLLQHEPHLYASLLQSWCYWGLLHAVLGEPVQVKHYVKSTDDGSVILTT